MKKLIFCGALALSLLFSPYQPVFSKQDVKPVTQQVCIIQDNMYDDHNSFVDESKYSLEKILESVEIIEHETTYLINYKDWEGKAYSTIKSTKVMGSGVVIEKKDGKAYILTNNHVVGNQDLDVILPEFYTLVDTKKVDEKVYVVKNKIFKKQIDAKVVTLDEILDMALLEVADSKDFQKFPYKIGNSDDLRAGDFVWVVGNPLGLEDYTLKGNVSKKDYPGDKDFFMIGCDVQPGYSGGVVVAIRDGKYELVGLVSATMIRSTFDGSVDPLGGYGIAIKISPIIKKVNDYFDGLNKKDTVNTSP